MGYKDFNQQEQEIFKQWLKDLLKTEVVTVEFTKSDGTLRVMSATLKTDLLPDNDQENSKTKKINKDVCVVWDLDQSSWRSFRYDRVISVKFTLG